MCPKNCAAELFLILIFVHLKLEIASAISALNEQKIQMNMYISDKYKSQIEFIKSNK